MSFKRILSTSLATLVFYLVSAQQPAGSYNAAWKKIDSLLNKSRLPNSALTEINKVYERAKKEKNDGQLTRTLIYKSIVYAQKEEDPQLKAIAMMEKEITTATEPALSIIQSITATMYWRYFQANRWRFYNRTETVNFKKDDVATWSIDDFHKKITELYLASIAKEKLLQQSKLEPFDPIIEKGNARHLRPTLFDLLADRALDYFQNSERSVTKPIEAFELNDPAAFDEASTFANTNFTSRDTLSVNFRALQLLQRLIRFHLNDAKPDALIDADVRRVKYVFASSILENKGELYETALSRIGNKYRRHPIGNKAWAALANYYFQQAMEYHPIQKPANRNAYVRAKAICMEVIALKDSGEAWASCKNMLQHILLPEINMETEKVNVPGQAFRTLITWRNFTQLNFRIVKVDRITLDRLRNNAANDEFWKRALALPVLKTFRRSLPETQDHQFHRAEINVDSLSVGQYALIASVENDFSMNKNPMAIQFFYVSNIAWVNKDQDFYVLDRSSGKPLVRASVQVWYQVYNSSTRNNDLRKGENVYSDKNGHFALSRPRTYDGNNNYLLEVRTTDDHLFLADNLYTYPLQEYNKQEIKQTFLFTDRSLYRPGQIVYVKGILINTPVDNTKSTVVPGFSTKLYLTDVNGQRVDSISVTTNEFGSYSAKFNLPSGLLNGMFTITDKTTNGIASIRVEEYKRPGFLTEIAQPTGTYRLDDTIKVTGNAKAYAGNTIDGAMVKYRVTRQVILPMYRYGFGKMIWPPKGERNVEIANGETATDAAGNFTISFKALPDKTVDKKNQPTFYYEVHADVTDNAGETRSASTSVSVAYQALQLKIDVPDKLHKDSLGNIKLSSTNVAGAFEKTTVNVSVYRLMPPNRPIFRDRLWEQPDTFTMSRDEYYRLFPYDIYSNENDPANWPRAQRVVDITDTTSSNSIFNLRNPKLAVGWYAVEAITKDKYGEEVKSTTYLQLFDQQISGPMVSMDVETKRPVLEPGDKASYTIRTNVDSAFVIHELIKKDNKQESSLVTLDKNARSFEIPVTENERGGMAVSVFFVKNNRFYSESKVFSIPYTNKELKVSYATYRDKTLPGSQEKWTVTISGYKGAKVAAELLTGMYDASLDQFYPHNWQMPSLWDYLSLGNMWNGSMNFVTVNADTKWTENPEYFYNDKYDRLIIDADGHYQFAGNAIRSKAVRIRGNVSAMDADGSVALEMAAAPAPSLRTVQGEMLTQGGRVPKTGMDNAADTVASPAGSQAPAQVRKNFNETAFFFPDLKTDADGNISFSFTMPEAVTQWKWMSLAHSKELAFGYAEKNIVTQKDLMVQPNAPRFMREGDRMDFSAKIVNITGKEITGQVELQLIDPSTGTSVDGWFQNMFPNQYFTVPAGQSVPVNFTIEIPFRYNRPVTYKVVARAGSTSDGEEAILPVVSNRLLVTESMPLPLRGQTAKTFKFEKLLQSGNSETLNHHALTVEFTSNPAWYAVQSLPYLMEYPYECSEQLFNRYYANALASTIANAAPRIKEIFERWKTLDTAALMSNLQKNQELKSVLLEETPWVLQAKTESEQKRNIALLFDMVRMNSELKSSLAKLKDQQLPNGGFSWFKGGRDDIFITQYILTGIGHLKKLKALPGDAAVNSIIRTAVPYLDQRMKESYDQLLKSNKGQEPAKGGIGYYEIQYLYMRSFYTEMDIPAKAQKAYAYYRKQSQLNWQTQGRYMQGMIALAMHRTNAATTAKGIMASLKQNALFSEEMGMYWAQPGGYYWYQAPVEMQSLLIEAFTEVTADSKSVTDMKTWLLKQKQTQHWRSTKATADACYALLLQGKDWLNDTPEVSIQLGGYTIRSNEQTTEAGTGYFKKTIDGKSMNPEMGNVQVFVKSQNVKEAQPSWGAVYWQYFEDLDKITPSSTPLKLVKKLFVEKNTDRGPVLQPVNEGDALKVGDKIKVRIELRVDRAMEYVHMKDMRAACLEPVNVLSSFKWQGGLGYYETTKDASTNFFFSWLPKGTFVFEYALFVTHTGTFSNGITSIQCMYAPEFTSNSEGVKIRVE